MTLVLVRPAAAQVHKDEVRAAVQQAFAAWEQVSCAGVRFEYKGEAGKPPALGSKTSEPGAIVVSFLTDWVAGNDAFSLQVDTGTSRVGEIYSAEIRLNAMTSAWRWSIGAEAGNLDIQTVIMKLIPNSLGFYYGPDPYGQSLQLELGVQHRTLSSGQQQGARFLYFEGGEGCVQPEEPPPCPEPGLQAPDAGASDAGAADDLCIFRDPIDTPPFHWAVQPVPYYIYVPDQGNLPGGTPVVPDGGVGPGDGGSASDGRPAQACTTTQECGAGEQCAPSGVCVMAGGEGCCRIVRSRQRDIAGVLWLIFGLGAFALHRRRQPD